MKLFAAQYPSPMDTEGTYENVYIQDTSHTIDYELNTFLIKFKMYILKNGKKVILDENQLSFRGTNAEFEQGLPTTNKTAILKVYNSNYNPEIPQTLEIPNTDYDENISPTLEVENPDYDENVEGSLPTMEITNPDYKNPTLFIHNPDYIPETYEIPLLQYLYTHEGQMPEQYEVIEWGFPTYENVMQYFSGGTLTEPELFLEDPFAREWFKNNLQMKGRYITNFEFV